MDRKEAFDVAINMVDEDKREEVINRLREVDTRAEKVAIMAEYGVELTSPEQILGDNWEDEGVELTIDELENVAGGTSEMWQRDCNCEP